MFGTDAILHIHRAEKASEIPPALWRDCDAIVCFDIHYRCGADRRLRPLPPDRARRSGIRSDRHRRRRGARHSRLQHAGLRHHRRRRSRDRHDACPDSRHRRLQRRAEARSRRRAGISCARRRCGVSPASRSACSVLGASAQRPRSAPRRSGWRWYSSTPTARRARSSARAAARGQPREPSASGRRSQHPHASDERDAKT